MSRIRKKPCVEIISKGTVAVASLTEATITDSDKISDVAEQIDLFIKENHPRTVIVDFENVSFFSSQLLGMLLNIRTKLKELEGEVVISSIEPQLYRIFKITNLDRIFKFFSDKESAISAGR